MIESLVRTLTCNRPRIREHEIDSSMNLNLHWRMAPAKILGQLSHPNSKSPRYQEWWVLSPLDTISLRRVSLNPDTIRTLIPGSRFGTYSHSGHSRGLNYGTTFHVVIIILCSQHARIYRIRRLTAAKWPVPYRWASKVGNYGTGMIQWHMGHNNISNFSLGQNLNTAPKQNLIIVMLLAVGDSRS